MADVKWIKIVTDIFDDEKILLIESLPEADSVIVIWFKLLCLAGKQNNSGVFTLNGRIPYTEDMLATIFRRKINTVKLAISTFEKFGMIEVVDNVITIPNWGKHQSLDQIEAKKEYMRGYMQQYRDKQKQIADGKPNCKTNSKANVRQAEGEGDKEGEGEGELEEDKELELENRNRDAVADFCKENNIFLSTPYLEDFRGFVSVGVEPELIVKCLEIAVYRNAKNKPTYAKGIIKRQLALNVLTLAEFEKQEAKQNESTATPPRGDKEARKLDGITYL